MTSQTRKKHNKYSNIDLLIYLDQLIFIQKVNSANYRQVFSGHFAKTIIDVSLISRSEIYNARGHYVVLK